jgi:hypothetical protein
MEPSHVHGNSPASRLPIPITVIFLYFRSISADVTALDYLRESAPVAASQPEPARSILLTGFSLPCLSPSSTFSDHSRALILMPRNTAFTQARAASETIELVSMPDVVPTFTAFYGSIDVLKHRRSN